MTTHRTRHDMSLRAMLCCNVRFYAVCFQNEGLQERHYRLLRFLWSLSWPSSFWGSQRSSRSLTSDQFDNIFLVILHFLAHNIKKNIAAKHGTQCHVPCAVNVVCYSKLLCLILFRARAICCVLSMEGQPSAVSQDYTPFTIVIARHHNHGKRSILKIIKDKNLLFCRRANKL